VTACLTQDILGVVRPNLSLSDHPKMTMYSMPSFCPASASSSLGL
jgi:hypothetical protein